MIKNLFLRLCLMMCVLFTLWQCSSEDFSLAENNPKRNNSEFFIHSSSGGLANRGGVDYVRILEAYNEEHNFLVTMPDQRGMPIWEKMRVLNSEVATGLIIPLSYDNETLSSVLFATLDDSNTVTGVKDYDNNLLEEIIYNQNLNKDFRQGILTSYLVTDHYTFNTTEFTNIPTDLFSGIKHGKDSIKLSFNGYVKEENSKSLGARLMISTTCLNIYHCKNNKPPSLCDGCSLCLTKTCETEYIFTDDDFPTMPSGNPGGGGGTGTGTGPAPTNPGQQPPRDPCASATVFYRLMPNCSGGGEVDDLPIQTNCETLTQATNLQDVKNAINNLKSKTTGKKEFAYEIERKFNNATLAHDFTLNYKEGEALTATVQVGGHIKGQAHNHPSDGMSIPSIVDIFWLRNCRDAIAPVSANAYNIVVCYDPLNPTNTDSSIVYSITIENYTVLKSKLDEMLNRPDLVNMSLAEKYDIFKTEFQKSFGAVQGSTNGMEKKFLETYSSFGISLNKLDKDTNKWEVLSLLNDTVNRTPCE